MRTFGSPPQAVLPSTRALRPDSATGESLVVEQVGIVAVPSGALYVGPRSGANVRDGVVIRVPAGEYAVVATIDTARGHRELTAISVILRSGDEHSRDSLPDGAYLHDAPGPLPLFDGDALAVSDAAIRDEFHDTEFPWDGWLNDVVDPAVDDAARAGRPAAHVPYPSRYEAIVVAGPIDGDVALFAGFDESGKPTALHLEPLHTPRTSTPNDDEQHVEVETSALHAPRFAEIDSPPSGPRSQSGPDARSDDEPRDAPVPAIDPAPAPEHDPGAERLLVDAVAGIEAAERRDVATSIALLTAVTDALTSEIGDRPAVHAALASRDLSGAQLVDQLVDVLVHDERPDEAIRALRGALSSPRLAATRLETLHLRRRLGELLLRSGDANAAVTSLRDARDEAEALANRAGPDPEGEAEFGRDYLAHVNFDLADAYLQSGEASTAAALAREAALQFDALRLARMAGRSAFLAASAYGALREEGSRLQAIAEAERIFRRAGELDGLGTALGFLGEADALRGEYDAALMKFGEARRVLTEAGELHNAAIAGENEAVCLDHLGNHADAARARATAAELERSAPDQRFGQPDRAR